MPSNDSWLNLLGKNINARRLVWLTLSLLAENVYWSLTVVCSRAGASFIEQKCHIIGDDSFISDFLSRFCKELLNKSCLVVINCLSWAEVPGNLLFRLFWAISSLIYGVSFLSFSHTKETKRVLRTLALGNGGACLVCRALTVCELCFSAAHFCLWMPYFIHSLTLLVTCA